MEIFHVTKKKLLALVALAVFLPSAVAILATTPNQAQPQPQQVGPNCFLAPQQLDHPLAMNTVVVVLSNRVAIAKTVAAEKEIFFCLNAAGVLDTIVDLEIFIEILEKLPGGGVISKTFEASICEKDAITGNVRKCGFIDVPPLQPQPPPHQIIERPRPPGDPIEMNTVVFRNTVKTVKLEKEIFFHDDPATPVFPDFIFETWVFTEIIEDFSTIPPTVTKRFEVAHCKKTGFGQLLGCGFVPIP